MPLTTEQLKANYPIGSLLQPIGQGQVFLVSPTGLIGISSPDDPNFNRAWDKVIPVDATIENMVKAFEVPDEAPPIDPSKEFSGDSVENYIDEDFKNESPEGFTSLYNMPVEYWDNVSLVKPGTPEYDDALNNISTEYFDLLEQQVNANTDQEKQIADYNWGKFKDNLQRSLNINLSNNAIQAWGQIQSLKNQYSGRGLAGSGLENEDLDTMLQRARLTDSRNRENTANEEQEKMRTYYSSYATPEQIKEFATKNPELAASWGLRPSEDTMNQIRSAITSKINVDELKKQHPDWNYEDIKEYINNFVKEKTVTYMDENGNYRSNLYQKYLYGSKSGVDEGTVDPSSTIYNDYDDAGNPIAPPKHIEYKIGDTGIKDIAATKNQFITGNVNAAKMTKNWNTMKGKETTPKTSAPVDSATASAAASKLGTQPTAPVTPAIPSTPKPTTPTTQTTTPTVTPDFKFHEQFARNSAPNTYSVSEGGQNWVWDGSKFVKK